MKDININDLTDAEKDIYFAGYCRGLKEYNAFKASIADYIVIYKYKDSLSTEADQWSKSFRGKFNEETKGESNNVMRIAFLISLTLLMGTYIAGMLAYILFR